MMSGHAAIELVKACAQAIQGEIHYHKTSIKIYKILRQSFRVQKRTLTIFAHVGCTGSWMHIDCKKTCGICSAEDDEVRMMCGQSSRVSCSISVDIDVCFVYNDINPRNFTKINFICFLPKSPQGNAKIEESFTFIPRKDSRGGDIGERIVGPLHFIAKVCRKNSKCVGFNSNGWLKRILKDESLWDTWTEDATKGFYVKKACIDRDLYDTCEERASRDECNSDQE